MKTLFMETTEISPERTVGEIEACLAAAGANAILKEYVSGSIDAISFKIREGNEDIPFRLPCRWKAIAEIFRKRANISDWSWNENAPYYKNRRDATEQKAKRVAWRQILRWTQAQLALVETRMVTTEEVFFPYIQTKSGKTLFEAHAGNRLLLTEKT